MPSLYIDFWFAHASWLVAHARYVPEERRTALVAPPRLRTKLKGREQGFPSRYRTISSRAGLTPRVRRPLHLSLTNGTPLRTASPAVLGLDGLRQTADGAPAQRCCRSSETSRIQERASSYAISTRSAILLYSTAALEASSFKPTVFVRHS